MDGDTAGVATAGEATGDFGAWFAGSKVVGGDGQPLVVHHFTYNTFAPAEFDRLWAARFFKRDPEGVDTLGLWFTDNAAARYVNPDWGGLRMDLHLAIRAPVVLADGKDDAWTTLRAMVREAGGSTAFRERLRGMGNDGVLLSATLLDGARQNVWLALEPTQVRSAAPNVDKD